MRRINLVIIPGDGIGPEVVDACLMVLGEIGRRFHFDINCTEVDMGGVAIDKYGEPLPMSSLEQCKKADSLLLGAIGGSKWSKCAVLPESGLLALRSAMGLYTNLRPARTYTEMAQYAPLKKSKNIDIMMVRDVTPNLGSKGRSPALRGVTAFDTVVCTSCEIEKIGRIGFELARKRNKVLTNVDKADVLETSRVWREVMLKLSYEFPDVSYSYMLADEAAAQLVSNPQRFDVIVAEEIIGELLSGELAALTGALDMLPSASIGKIGSPGLYMPAHGPATELAGRDIANPIAMILSAAMMFRYSLSEPMAADAIENGVRKCLKAGIRTYEMLEDKSKAMSTRGVGAMLVHEVAR